MGSVVISLGGSLIVPDDIDHAFLAHFRDAVDAIDGNRFFIVCGGGAVARSYQEAARDVGVDGNEALDWLGIYASRLNGMLVKSMFGLSQDPIVTDPGGEIPDSRIVVGAGFEPGASTDLRAVQLAVRFSVTDVINMSGIGKVFTADPRDDKDAKPIDTIRWKEFLPLVGTEWIPGANAPFDPIASQRASEAGIRVHMIGKDVSNMRACLEGKSFEGTSIVP